jgi:hypothetical protein
MPDNYEDEEGKVDRAKKDALLSTRYLEEETVFKTEQEIWEEEQAKHAIMTFGAKSKLGKRAGDEYEMVFEDQVAK